MNLSIPMLLCDNNEDFRSLVRDMLIKHGFFHVVEAVSQDEVRGILRAAVRDHFVILQASLLEDESISLLRDTKKFIVLSQPDDPKTPLLAARLGIKHFLSFPFPSRQLVEKIGQLS